MVKIVQSIVKTLMMNGDEIDAEGDFMPNAVGINICTRKVLLSLFDRVTQ